MTPGTPSADFAALHPYVRAVIAARDAYDAWDASGKRVDGVDPRDPDWRALRAAGAALAAIGGGAAMRAAVAAWFDEDEEPLQRHAALVVDHAWAGITGWHEAPQG